MLKKIILGVLLFTAVISFGYCQVKPPVPIGPVPNENQMRWQEMEYYAFLHFSLNTFTDQEWGFGDEDVKLFNPVDLDCRQWARVCKEAGMKGIILVAKHHCGFCLWPSEYTEYSVKNAPWKNGKGDVVREMADACREYGLKLGLYLSPWDRNHADYGKPEYITYFRNQLKELLTNYGPIFEIWFDGANGGSGYYGGARETRKIDRRTYYDWKNTYKMIRELQPDIVIWNDGGDRADLRWVGTEAGYVGETNWSLLNATGDVPEEKLRFGVENGDAWVPGEVNTSIRPGWFYHRSEDNRVKTPGQLMNTYYSSIGRNATLLLNFPIDPRGLIHKNDEEAVLEFAAIVKETFANDLAKKKKVVASNFRGNSKYFRADNVLDGDNDTYWTTDDNVTNASLTINFKNPTTFNRFLVQEYIRLGQRVKAFTIEAFIEGKWKMLAKGTTIGYKRILLFPTITTTRLRLNINESKNCPVISNIGIYNAPQIHTGYGFNRNKGDKKTLTSTDPETILSLAAPPEASISNGIITAKVYLPDPERGYYRSTRFDWSGAVYSLNYKGHDFYGTWYDRIDPEVINWVHRGQEIVSGPCSALFGPVDEFQTPLGYNEANPGGKFIKIGVGVLKRDSGDYNRFQPYDVINSGKWSVRINKSSVEFTQELNDPDLGYAYIYKKVVRLEKGSPEMVIQHSLKNAGQRSIQSDVYNHNFVVLDKQAPGPDFNIRVPYQIRVNRPPDNNLAEVVDNRVVYLKTLSGKDEVVVPIQGFTDNLSDTEIIIENKKVGAGMKITGDRPLIRNLLWSVRTVLAFEPYIGLDIAPGVEFTWKNSIKYYTIEDDK